MEVESRDHVWWYDDHLWNCDDHHLRSNGVECFQMINGSHGQQLHKVEHPKNARLCRVIHFGIMLLLRFLVERQKNCKPLSISFLTYTRTICQDNLAHKSLTFLSFNIMHVFCFSHWKDCNFWFSYLFCMIYYTHSNAIKTWFSHILFSFNNFVMCSSV